MKKFINPKQFPKILFILSLCILAFGYGFIASYKKWFPYSLVKEAVLYINNMDSGPDSLWYYTQTGQTKDITIYDESSAYNALSLVTSMIEDDKMSIRVINMEGELIHSWDIDWFDLWPNVTHIPESDHEFPKARPGTNIHGTLLLENGDVIFNFEDLGMIRLDVCGNVVWRLEYRTHHSIFQDEFGDLWVPGLIRHTEPLAGYPNYTPPFDEFTVIKVSLEGEVLKEISVFDVLKQNELMGLLNLASQGGRDVYVTGDTLHLNDVEIFPSNMEEGAFKAGDVLISLRNINTVLVFRQDDLEVTHISTGTFVRQHDADFIDGNTISVFDNYNIGPKDYGQHSKIQIMSFPDGEYQTYYTGNKERPFYTSVMGKHEWLPNGNLLITESKKGRAFEVDQEGETVWEFINLAGDGFVGIVEELHRLPVSFTEEYFGELTQGCSVSPSE